MNKAITVEQAKKWYETSRFNNGKQFRQLYAVCDKTLHRIVKHTYTSKQTTEKDMKILEMADMIFLGDFGDFYE